MNKLKIYKNKDLGIYKVGKYKIGDVVDFDGGEEGGVDVLRIVGFREEDGVMLVDGYFDSDDCGGSINFEWVKGLSRY
jgi:hypothetical protein